MTAPALTVRQPWAGLLAAGLKPVENRTWKRDYRGPLWLHAGAGKESVAPWVREQIVRGEKKITPEVFHAAGALIAEVEITGIHRDTGCCQPWGMPDQWHWQIRVVRALARPVPARGMQGLWSVPAELIPTEPAAPVADEVLEAAAPDDPNPDLPRYHPDDIRTHWANCAGCGHRVLRPEHGEPRCPGCRVPLPAGISRVEGRP